MYIPGLTLVTLCTDVIVTQITTAVCGNAATVTSYQQIQDKFATLPHTAVVFRMQSSCYLGHDLEK